MTNTDREYFERLYERERDPWGFETEWYEERKYALTVACLPKQTYESAFEPGCSIGVLTEKLAPRCEKLLAYEMIPSALEQARNRLRPYPHVRLAPHTVPDEWPDEIFDLVVLSEIAYYFDEDTLSGLVEMLTATTSIGASVVAVHWRGETDYPLSGDAAHDVIDGAGGLTRVSYHREPLVALDVWERSW